MIITCKKEIPFRWIVFSALPSTVFTYTASVMGICFLFSLKKFVENPAGLTFVMSLPGFVSIFLVPVGNFVSDRIWTRFGRRKPFIVCGWAGMAVCLALIPLAPTFWMLLGLYIVFNLFNDIGGQLGPMEPLTQEIVPPHHRGRATGIASWFGNLTSMIFYFVALGRFDDVRFMAGVPVTGEQVIYSVAALLMLVVLLFVMLGIKETDQASPLRGQHLNVRNFFAGLLDSELWPVYTLIFSSAMLNAGLGALGGLLYTDQWGYSKQDMGTNVMVGGVINVFIIGFLSVIADKFNRMRAYQALIVIAMALKVIYYVYVSYIIPDRRPTLVELVVFGESISIVGILTAMVYTPLVYDYVTRNKMGTYMAGAGVVTRLTGIITVNGVGLFIWGFTVLFQPPAGELARVVLNREADRAAVATAIHNGTWTLPGDGSPVAPSRLNFSPWYGTGLVLDTGRCWEIRLPDAASEHMAAEKEDLEKEESPLLAGSATAAHQARVAQIGARIREIDDQLDSKARAFQRQVAAAFQGATITDGGQVLNAAMREALVITLPAAARPDGGKLEKVLTDLRHSNPDVIDLRPVKGATGYGVALSSLLPSGADAAGDAAVARTLESALEAAAALRSPGLLGAAPAQPAFLRQPALVMGLLLVEDPVDTRISPITRLVNVILSLFGDAPSPERRLLAMARNLRLPGQTEHVRVEPAPDHATAISVTALMAPGATRGGDDPTTKRLRSLLGTSPDGPQAAQARAFLDRIEQAAEAQRLTVAHPFVTVAYAPMKYDYMCGYIWMFLMGAVGLAITFAFVRREKRGLIRKYGVEEALAS